MIRLLALLGVVVPGLILAQGQPTPGPGARGGHSLVYHEQLQKVLLLDGEHNSRNHRPSQIWAWDGARWALLDAGSASGPVARYVGAAVYDSQRQQLVSFGGRVGIWEDPEGDTWTWAGRWNQMADASVGRRVHHALAFDSARGRMVMFGGQPVPTPPGPWATDTWEWDGQAWTRAATEGPLGRVSTMVYDEARREVVLFGGVGASPGPNLPQPLYGDTWVWNGRSWRQASASGPPARTVHALVYDRKAKAVLLYGGRTDPGATTLGDFWQWDGSRWTEIKVDGITPGMRRGHAMAYDASRGRTVLFGGSAVRDSGSTLSADVWEWDGRRWTQVEGPPVAAWPPGWPEFIRVFESGGAKAAIDRFREYGDVYWEAMLITAARQMARPGPQSVDVLPLYLAGLELRPGSAMLLEAIAGVHETRGETAKALEFTRKTLDALPRDSTILATRRARMEEAAKARLQRLGAKSGL